MATTRKARGAPVSFIRICKALHNHTVFSIRTSGVVSEKYAADRGLKEGCPSSPPLFNIYHQTVLCDFRARRKRKAEEQRWSPGVPWKVIVDDRLQRSNEERQTSRHQHQTLLQDVEFADDTATIAMEQEFPQADRLLDQTFLDWTKKAKPGQNRNFGPETEHQARTTGKKRQRCSQQGQTRGGAAHGHGHTMGGHYQQMSEG